MTVTEIDSLEAYEKAIKDAGIKTICIDFSATWCGPCRMISPKFEAMAAELEGKFIALKVDVDAVAELAEKFNVSAMPTFVIVKDGKEVETLVGADEKKLRAMIETNI